MQSYQCMILVKKTIGIGNKSTHMDKTEYKDRASILQLQNKINVYLNSNS